MSAISGTFFVNPGLEQAIEQIQAIDLAEKPGTPLNNLTGRVFSDPDAATGGNGDDIAEFAGRQCYRSWGKGREASAYIQNILSESHGSIFEHSHVGFQITGVSRTFSHELIRHSVGTGVSQESQRYVDAKDVMFVVPPLLANHVEGMTREEMEADEELIEFRLACGESFRRYQNLQDKFNERLKRLEASGASEKALTSAKKRANEAARSVLPNAAETRMVYTSNLRALRHILLQRGNEFADLEIRRVAVQMLEVARSYAPLFFADMEVRQGNDELPIITATWGRC